MKLYSAEKTFSVALDDSRPILKGCLFEINDNLLTAVALDGFRMSVVKKEVQANDILSEQETNEFAIGKIENGKIIIFKNGLPVKVSCGKVIDIIY